MSTAADDPTRVPPRPTGTTRVTLDGTGLTVAGLVRLADGAATPDVPRAALERAGHAWRTAQRLAATGRLYGRGTGVGAQRSVAVDAADETGHGLRLLRSHAGGAGRPLPARQIRAMLAVRANQLLAGGSGIHPDFVHALTEALRLGVHPVVHEYGGLGTGDLTALAETGLTLIGERAWATDDPTTPAAEPPGRLPAPVTLRPGDALALLSSNALTLGQAGLGCHRLDVLLRATHVVAALSLAAVSGSPEAYAAPLHALRPHPGAAHAAAEVRRVLGLPDRPHDGGGRRVQDPYGFRAFPQAHGCALDAAAHLRRTVEAELNSPSENPLIDTGSAAAHHHGGFYAAPLALALDGCALALLGTARLSAARLAALLRPDLTGLPAFLATGPAGSSGAMILEYTANSALAELRSQAAAPASAGHAVLSHGLEEAASFASQAARQALRAAEAYTTVLACELVAAVRALRLHPAPPPIPAYDTAAADLPPGTEDRPLTADVARAGELLPRLAQL
ncbi:aromatic amino acid lyase [Streptomyces sp. NPDC006610]|uniref:aromatic amino acid lyase n=1 Tax=Streptomyces sp. NPDC006610 TaxID=3154584 RepID=UPI0033A5317D